MPVLSFLVLQDWLPVWYRPEGHVWIAAFEHDLHKYCHTSQFSAKNLRRQSKIWTPKARSIQKSFSNGLRPRRQTFTSSTSRSGSPIRSCWRLTTDSKFSMKISRYGFQVWIKSYCLRPKAKNYLSCCSWIFCFENSRSLSLSLWTFLLFFYIFLCFYYYLFIFIRIVYALFYTLLKYLMVWVHQLRFFCPNKTPGMSGYLNIFLT